MNGDKHKAEAFAAKTGKKVFSIGVAGSEAHNAIKVAFSRPQCAPKVLENQIDTFTSFAPENIEEFYREIGRASCRERVWMSEVAGSLRREWKRVVWVGEQSIRVEKRRDQ